VSLSWTSPWNVGLWCLWRCLDGEWQVLRGINIPQERGGIVHENLLEVPGIGEESASRAVALLEVALSVALALLPLTTVSFRLDAIVSVWRW
jgi:hypothetical protein